MQGRVTTTKMLLAWSRCIARQTTRFELKMVSHYYTLRMYVTTVFWNNGQTQMLTLNRNSHHMLNIAWRIIDIKRGKVLLIHVDTKVLQKNDK